MNNNIYKGALRHMVVIKNPGGALFEEAYFVVKGNQNVRESDRDDMVAEANRIVSEKLIKSEKRKSNIKKYKGIVMFAFGALLSGLITFLACLILM